MKKNSFRSSKDIVEHSFYLRWKNMKSRCLNQKNSSFKDYGGRGIAVCKRWLDFENFKEDMFQSFQRSIIRNGIKNTTIDRKDVNGGYSKSNCRWTTTCVQNTNKRNSIKIDGVPIKEICLQNGVKYVTAFARIKRGLSLGDASSLPIQRCFYKEESAQDAAVRLGLSRHAVYYRIYKYGWSKKRAFSTPAPTQKAQ